MTIPQQLLTAFLILVSLPLVLKLLWKVRLLPFVLGLSLPYVHRWDRHRQEETRGSGD